MLQYIYNSRNYKCLIDYCRAFESCLIYNSRNYKCLIDPLKHTYGHLIYNSRNYKCLIDSLFFDNEKSYLQ